MRYSHRSIDHDHIVVLGKFARNACTVILIRPVIRHDVKLRGGASRLNEHYTESFYTIDVTLFQFVCVYVDVGRGGRKHYAIPRGDKCA